VFGGSLGEVYGEKIVSVQGLAIKTDRPLIGINDGAGARIHEGVVSLGLYHEIFHRNILASGVIPQISPIMGAPGERHPRSWCSRVGVGTICRGRGHRADGSPAQ
jgi:propionyl-CoA carboxylase beta chain